MCRSLAFFKTTSFSKAFRLIGKVKASSMKQFGSKRAAILQRPAQTTSAVFVIFRKIHPSAVLLSKEEERK